MNITLYTPATGLPDLEAKIAYGLARIGIEADYEPVIIPQNGFYQVDFGTHSSEKINRTFQMIAERLMSSDRFFNLGVKAKDKSKYPANQDTITRLLSIDISSLFNSAQLTNLNIKRNKLCGHRDLLKFGATDPSSRLGGLVLLASSHAGKPYFRDRRFDTFNLSLCEVCGYLAVLGLYSFGFNIQMGIGKNRKYAVVLPIPEKELTVGNLQMLLSLQKTLHNFWLSDVLPLRTFTIGLLAKVPSISDIIDDLQLHFHLSLVSKDNRGDTVIEQTASINAIPFSKFISSSPYNSATVNKLLGSSKIPPKISSLIEITNILEHGEESNLLKFARLYVLETTPKDSNKWTSLLYPETTKYLLEEVAMIKEEIIKNKAVRSIAKTLGYFVWNKDYQNYSFADGLRNAKTHKEVRRIFEKLEREAKSRYDQEVNKQNGNPPRLPHPDDIEEINHLMQEGGESFEQVKTTLYLLAFTWESYKTIKLEQEVQNA